MVARTAPDVQPIMTVGCQALGMASAETALGILATEVVVKKRRVTRRRMKSFSSPERNDWRIGEKTMCGEPIRIRGVSVTSAWGWRIDDKRVSPSIDVVPSRCGDAGYAAAMLRMYVEWIR